ncbi:MAG TPA: ferredoxin [Solirubrobacteraceae bacterium]|nr:ferredoxin [Solirubrobacteraceae bacterium]
MTLVPTIDAGACAAHGDCVDVAPGVFVLTGDVAEVVGTGPDDLLVRAAEACPSVAIVLTDDAGRQVYP